MIQEAKLNEYRKKIEIINNLTYVEDRIKKTIELKVEMRNDFNEFLDELFSILNLKKNSNE